MQHDDDATTDMAAVLADLDEVRVPAFYTKHAGRRVRDLEVGTLAWFSTRATPPAQPESFRAAVLAEYRKRCGGGFMPRHLRPIAHEFIQRAYEQCKALLEDEEGKHLLSDARNALVVLLHGGAPPPPRS
jgi:hypothetical protein